MINILGLNFHIYGFILGIAILLAWEITNREGRRRGFSEKFLNYALILAVSFGIIGARIYHVIDFWEKYYKYNPERIFYVWEGGLAIWGAILGGLIGILIAQKLAGKKNKLIEFFDISFLGLPLAQAVGRLGNWVNGELYGRNGEPLFAFEGILNLILFGVLWKIKSGKTTGLITGIYLTGYGLIRIFLEGFRQEEIIWRIFGIPTAVIFSCVAILTGLFLIWRKQS